MSSQIVTGIYRLRTSEQLEENPAAGFQDQIALYDKAFNSKYDLAQILGHELAHTLCSKLSIQERVSYAKEAEWETKEYSPGKLILTLNRKSYVEEDGRKDPDEDFANNIEYFLFHPRKLLEKSPRVFEWIELKYGDKLKLRKGN